LADDLAEWSEEDFILPMRDEKYGGYGSLELLLNGLFPVTAKMSLHPLDKDGKRLKKRSGSRARHGLYNWDAADKLQAWIEINARYFISGKSSLILKITNYEWWLTNKALSSEQSLMITDFSDGSKESIVTIKDLISLSSADSHLDEGDYFQSSTQKILVIRDVSREEIKKIESNIRDVSLMLWIRLSVNGAANAYRDRDDLWFPFRGQEVYKKPDSDPPYTWITASS